MFMCSVNDITVALIASLFYVSHDPEPSSRLDIFAFDARRQILASERRFENTGAHSWLLCAVNAGRAGLTLK